MQAHWVSKRGRHPQGEPHNIWRLLHQCLCACCAVLYVLRHTVAHLYSIPLPCRHHRTVHSARQQYIQHAGHSKALLQLVHQQRG